MTAFAASSLEAEPMRLPTISLVEQPMMKISPLRYSALLRIKSTASAAWRVSSV